ncbi:response regulator transcription factor [Halarcobacter anaerophilus]|uniref:DNA-binding response regulator n=1 Tax=Halarcobacter anaerophilus TaxID=877500 RepID=A0A4Q0Y2R9_9BACT|nr:response regulator transcription factor [Halarcobacter anaerophilus]QDF29145.1 two-component system response regulator [Halarcobacter anaerophilus]RXJ64400.1 DNA-binding response regulator [Halarcobacter anaerophilus]
MYRILILEDDELFKETLEDFLEEEEFEVVTASNGEEVLELCYEQNFDLYLFDINVPKINGIETLKELRKTSDDTPTIYLTSYKDKDKLTQGFLSGCDDYLKKPIDLDELLLRIWSLLKRSGKPLEMIYLNDEISFDPKNRRVLQKGEDIFIAGKVIDLLELFLEKKDVIITKEMIINKLWGFDQEYSEGSIRVYINNLKKLLGKDRIKNIKGIGYKIEL